MMVLHGNGSLFGQLSRERVARERALCRPPPAAAALDQLVLGLLGPDIHAFARARVRGLASPFLRMPDADARRRGPTNGDGP